mmetsp:Transcript_9789/g.14609  ORF Transcript_9789/g.14609 Transcript_9789/m.14609 type:complete len:109 (+) Transcript_9789:175-501(+)
MDCLGYQDQIQDPAHFEVVGSDDNGGGAWDGSRWYGEVFAYVYVKASETVRVCRGRNIALISEESRVVIVDENVDGSNGKTEFEWMPSGGLKALTWVDPLLWMLMWGM